MFLNKGYFYVTFIKIGIEFVDELTMNMEYLKKQCLYY